MLLQVNVKAKSAFNNKLFALNVVISIPVPDNTAKADIQTTQGMLLFAHDCLSHACLAFVTHICHEPGCRLACQKATYCLQMQLYFLCNTVFNSVHDVNFSLAWRVCEKNLLPEDRSDLTAIRLAMNSTNTVLWLMAFK